MIVLALMVTGCAAKSERPVWLQQLPVQSAVAPATLEKVAAAAADQLAGRARWPEELEQDREPRVLWVTLPSGEPHLGRGHGLKPALQMALRDLPQLNPAFLKVDLVCLSDSYRGKLTSGLDGIGYAEPPGLLPDQLSHRALLKGGKLRSKTRRPSFRIRTQQWLWTPEGSYPLYRGHRVYSPDSLSAELLLQGARSAGDFLLRQLGTDGRFVYSYRPAEDRQDDKEYNLLRHAGCCYALAQLGRATGRPEYLEGARKGLKYLVAQLRPTAGGRLSLVERQQVKLGGNGLAVIALLEYQRASGVRAWFPQARGLGLSLLAAQSADGAFRVHKSDFSTGENSDFTSGYYPGEAILALADLGQLEPAGPWEKAARRGAHYLIEIRDKGVPDLKLPHDHWLLLALAELQKQRPDSVYAQHMARICRAIRASQLEKRDEADWNGGFYTPPRLGPTAIRCEGMGAAWQWLPPTEQEATRRSLLAGVAFQLQAQLQPESCAYFPQPERAQGGIPRSLTNFELRIDYSQHYISSSLGALRLFAKPTKGDGPEAQK